VACERGKPPEGAIAVILSINVKYVLFSAI
jgi:hypothetical protein